MKKNITIKNKKKAFLFTLLFALIATLGFSQTDQYWSANTQSRTSITTDKAVARLAYPKEFKLFNLNIDPLRQELFSIVGNHPAKSSTIITLPNPDGGLEQFEVYEASNMDPALQVQFPQIRAYSGRGITDKYATLKLSISPQGIETMIFRADNGAEFMEPYSQDHHVYSVYKSQREKGKMPWTCSTVDKQMAIDISGKIGNPNKTTSSDGILRTMRLAQSVTAEYSNYFGAFNAAQIALVMAGINNTMTRCNGCYEKDLAVHLNLIPNENLIIYYDPNTDPYSPAATGAGGAWNGELQANLTATIGESNYDIGHLFGATGGGGNAGCIGCVCVNGQKGSGFTSPADGIPMGDNFDIDYVVHEVGHQMGGNHSFTFQNEGTQAQKEVGAGITIMGYAGITAYDPAPHSLDIYHAYNIFQIQTNLAAKACPIATNISANNATPVVAAVANATIPMQTPFALTGSATDANGDPLTYCWEQNDAGNSFTAANSVAFTSKAGGPNFLSFSPTVSGTRLFPRLSTILAGLQITPTLPGGDAICNIEALSNVSRTLNFRLTVRDNSPYVPVTVPGTGKVGQTAFTDMVVTVTNTAGPFNVTAPNTNVTWTVGTTQNVTWNVNNTTAAPVSCANVKITLSTDGGQTFPVVLAASVPNNGSASITVPNNVTTTARIKVEAVGNIFFDIDDANFSITSTPATTSDLHITKTDGAGVTTYTPGGTTTYTIVATNPVGPDPVTGAIVADNFPAAITSVAWTAAYAGGATGPASGAGNINATVNIPVGGTATFTAVCNISAGATGNLVNTATITAPAGVTDPNPADNTATDTDTQAGACSWVASTVIPIPIMDQPAATVGTTLYTFGGVSNGAPVANSYKFDGTTWTAIAATPQGLEYASTVSDGTNIYVMGGASTAGTPQTTNYRYNVAANTYTTLAPFTTGTWNHCAVYLNGKIYKFGGTGPGTSPTNALEIYDIAGNSWSAGAPYPLAMSFMSAYAQGNFIYAAGGYDGANASVKTYRYDPVANTWDDASIADLPATRWGAASGFYASGFVMAGGYVAGSATANISTSAISWNLATNTWTAIPTMIGERSRMGGAVLSGSFYVIGGRSIVQSAFVGTNDNQKLTCPIGGPAVIVASPPAVLTAESCVPPNNAIDPGETVTLNFCVLNTGGTNTTNLVGTLLNTGGVTAPSGPQTYGVVTANGAAVCKPFTFTANGTCGSTITASIQMQDGATNLGTITYTLQLGALNTVTILSQNFDAVVAPALPAGWTTAATGVEVNWVTSTTTPNSVPNTAFVPDVSNVGNTELFSPTIAIPAGATPKTLTFKNLFNMELTFDGEVLEISINGGAYQDIITAGGVFVAGGYTGTISSSFASPIAGRQAWTGLSGGTAAAPAYITTTVTLPAAANGQNIVLKWRAATDNSATATGVAEVEVDDISLSGSSFVCCSATPVADLSITKTDNVAVYIPGSSTTYTITVTNNGPSTVTGATVTDNFPAFITAVNWTAVYAGGATGPASGSGNISALVNMPSGGTATFTAVCTISGAASGNLVNTATVAVPAGTTDPNLANNTSTDTDTQTSPPITVTATAGTPGPTPYLTLKLAFDAINAGTHQGTVVVNVNGNSTETAPAVLNRTGTGSSSYTSVLVRPTVDGVSVSGAIPSAAVVKLNATTNVTIDGDNPNTAGTNRNLTIQNTSATAPSIVWIGGNAANVANNIVLKNCNLINGASVASGVIVSDNTTLGNAGNFTNVTIQNNSISNCYIANYNIANVAPGNGSGLLITGNDLNTSGATSNRLVGIYVQGIDGATVSNNNIGNMANTLDAANVSAIWLATSTVNSTVSGNSITNMSGTVSAPRGIVISPAGSGVNINVSGNTITGLTSSSTGTTTGIYYFAATNGVTIQKNKISNIKNTNAGGWGANGIQLASTLTTANTANVYNNFVSDVAGFGFTGTGVADNGYGIIATSGGGYNLYFNTVLMNTSQTVAGNPAALMVNYAAAASTLDVRDNIFANTQTAGGTQHYCVYSIAAATSYTDINYNDYYTAGPNLGFLGSNRANLAAWQTATTKDANSLSLQPFFVSATDLHLAPASNCGLDGKGFALATVLNDIDGDVRSVGVAPNGPDMGADEFTSIAPSATIAYLGSPYCSLSGTATVTQTGTPGGTYSSTPGLSLNPANGNVTLGTSTAGTYTVTYTVISGNCPQFVTTASITIVQGASATISYAGSPYCPNPGTAFVTQTGTPGGTYSSTPGLVIDPVTGNVNTGTSTPGTYVVTYTVGAVGICPQYTTTTTITIGDSQPPVINCPPNVVVSNTSNQCGAIVNYLAPTATDNCSGVVTVTSSPASGGFFPVGTTIITVTATDVAGNTSTCTFTVKVVDSQYPTITCPANIIVSNTVGQCGANVTWAAPVATDNCPGVTVTSSIASGSFFPIGTTTVTITAKDASNNITTCSFTVRVNDTQLPTITCPPNIITTAVFGQCGATVAFVVTATDNCPGVTVVSNPASGSFFPVGITTVTNTATDASGNTATCTFTVRVNDTQLPVITCPGNIIVSNTAGQCGANVNFTVTATDNCPGVTVTSVPASGSFFPVGTTTVTSTATDASGNTRTCTFTVKVNDTQLPVITCPANIVVSNTTGQCGAIVNFTTTATDNCPGVTVTSSPASGSFFPVGTTTVTSTATDAAGNTATCTFTVKVNDTQLPTVTCSPNIVVSNTLNQCGAIVNYPAPVASDNCPGVTVTSSPASGTFFPVGTTTVTATATDAAGNTGTCTFTVKVNDTQLPVITCPGNIVANPPVGTCTAVVTYAATVTDNCPGTVITVIAGLPSGSTFPSGVTTVTLQATDASGNTATCSFTVTVNDAQLPVITTQPSNQTGCATGSVVYSVVATNALSYQWQVSTNGGATYTNIAGATSASVTISNLTVAMTGNLYRVNVIGLCRTVTSNAASLTVNFLPTITLSASPLTLLQPGDQTTITAVTTPSTGGTLVWSKDGTILAFNGRSLVIGVDGIGTYTVVFTDGNGCSVTSASLVIGPKVTNRVFVYPTPNNGHFQVRINNHVGEQVTLRIFDSRGARVYNQILTITSTYQRNDVDLSRDSGGAYLVEVVDSTGTPIDSKWIVIAH